MLSGEDFESPGDFFPPCKATLRLPCRAEMDADRYSRHWLWKEWFEYKRMLNLLLDSQFSTLNRLNSQCIGHMHIICMIFFASFLTKLWTLPKRCHIKYCTNSRATECHNDRSWKFDCHLVAFAIGMNPKYLCSYQVPSHVGSHSIFWAAGSSTAGCHKYIACCTAVLWQHASLPQKVVFRMADFARTCRRAGEHSLDRQELLVLTDFLSKQVLGAWQCRSGSLFASLPCLFQYRNPIARGLHELRTHALPPN